VVRRHELTDRAWEEIAPLLPANGRPRGQWAEHRQVLNGILWNLATGVPRPTGPGSGCWPLPRPARCGRRGRLGPQR
jgi:hypothetical protein